MLADCVRWLRCDPVLQGSGRVLFKDGESEDRHEGPATGETSSEETGKCQEGPWAETGCFTSGTGLCWETGLCSYSCLDS